MLFLHVENLSIPVHLCVKRFLKAHSSGFQPGDHRFFVTSLKKRGLRKVKSMDTAEKPTDLVFLKGSAHPLRTVSDSQIKKKKKAKNPTTQFILNFVGKVQEEVKGLP